MTLDSPPVLDPEAGVALLLTDIVDSAEITARLGDDGAAALWAAHDRVARDLLREWRGREIDKSDGFLILFASVREALGYANAYHEALLLLEPPLTARAGIHYGQVRLRENPTIDVALGAKPLEVDGAIKPAAARIMSAARPRQTLLSHAAGAALMACCDPRLVSHGHWRFKGFDDVFELFEAAQTGVAAEPPPDGAKAWRVVRRGEVWEPLQAVPHSLPAERDRFIGRTGELAGLRQRLRGGARLVSLLGPGGTGKTRLALRFGWEALGDHPDGVWFCDLSAARSTEGIVHAMAQGLRLALAGTDPLRQVGDAIRGRPHCLVIVDNFEQVAEHAAETLGCWLEQAPKAVFCVTTRERLGIVGEQAFAVQPLSVEEGVVLLRERGAAAGAQAFTAADEAASPELVRLLDGLPLAIELAASRLPVLPPSRLLPRMGERFRLLVSARGRPDRHATLRATLDWSWDLLAEAERMALAQLSVFEGGFTLEAAEVVLDLTGCGGTPWVVDVVQALVQKSLVRVVGEGRFDLLRAVQEYAAWRLGLTDAGVASRLRHARHFGAYDERRACAGRCVELENLIAATRRMICVGEAAAAAAVLLAAWAPLKLVGPFSVAVGLAAEVLATRGITDAESGEVRGVAGSAKLLLGDVEAARGDLEAALRFAPAGSLAHARAACVLGELESNAGHARRAQDLLSSVLAVARDLGDAGLQCRAMNALGGLALEQSRLDEAIRLYEQALAVARVANDRRWEGGVLGNLGVVHGSRGDLVVALECFDRALECARDSGDRRFEGNALCNLGLLLLDLGRTDDARIRLEAALGLSRTMGHARLEGTVLSNLGLLADSEERFESAVSHHRAAVECAVRQTDQRCERRYRVYLGRSLAHSGRLDEARACLQAALMPADELPDPVGHALAMCSMAEVELRAGRVEAAQEHLATARALGHEAGAGDGSELGRDLLRLETLLREAVSPG
ncbi:tetratricopeptide repeat protein [Aquincola sp. S2]|uniref:Tetratricopeptide repeat protein n=1 Tax=Pseudaquabacterium terrae TaxID=2732868 RepID=A0ABX2EH78_9BURK|nr:tetratricopeptide repeat protein [Aquabacterium terrae]NRF67985.1 tetratricopeptide repeat protein [Aquabacterium terrae]